MDFNRFAAKILSLYSAPKPREALMADILLLVQQEMDMECVGLRLNDGLDYPYYFTRGFSNRFVEKEMYLCTRRRNGEPVRDAQGLPVLECLCGQVIRGQLDKVADFATDGGSFWTNSSTQLLADEKARNRLGRTRNRCNADGYESVALIPVKTAGEIHGLIQLNDRRRDMFTVELIRMMEGVAASIGLLFAVVQAREDLEFRANDVKRLVGMRAMMLERIAVELRNRKAADVAGEDMHQKLDAILKEVDILKGVLPICMKCRRIRNDQGYWENIESYIYERTNAAFSHTYCPDCCEAAFRKLAAEELPAKPVAL